MASERGQLSVIVLFALLALAVALSFIAVQQRPPSRLIGQSVVNAGTTLGDRGNLLRGEEPRLHLHWDIDLRLDPAVPPPGPAWILHEGKQPGEGYELHWQPTDLVLSIRRSRPMSLLLGSVRLASKPKLLAFHRRAGVLTTTVDGHEVLRCLDPMGLSNPGAGTWGCWTSGVLGDATITVQVLTPPETPIQSGSVAGDPFAMAMNAVAGTAAVRGETTSGAQPFGFAATALADPMLSSSDQRRLSIWQSASLVHWRLSRPENPDDPDQPRNEQDVFEDVASAIEPLQTLVVTSASSPLAPPEAVGALLDLLPEVVAQACRIPLSVTANDSTDGRRGDELLERILAHRDRWLRLAARMVDDVQVAGQGTLTTHDSAKLALLRHAIGCLLTPVTVDPACADDRPLTADGPRPMPLDAPQWLATRWRALAGGNPAAARFPPVPAPEGPIDRSFALLANYADLDPLAAVGLRQHVSEALAKRDALLALGQEREADRRQSEDAALAACDAPQVPQRERQLTRALIALHIDDERPGLIKLVRLSLRESGLLTSDPLALALEALMAKRTLGQGFDPASTRRDVRRWFPEFQGIMDGSPEATGRIWRIRLPYAQGLAIALVMQQVFAQSNAPQPAWDLLERVPGHTLPLHLLALPRITAPAASGAVIAPSPGGPPIVP